MRYVLVLDSKIFCKASFKSDRGTHPLKWFDQGFSSLFLLTLNSNIVPPNRFLWGHVSTISMDCSLTTWDLLPWVSLESLDREMLEAETRCYKSIQWFLYFETCLCTLFLRLNPRGKWMKVGSRGLAWMNILEKSIQQVVYHHSIICDCSFDEEVTSLLD